MMNADNPTDPKENCQVKTEDKVDREGIEEEKVKDEPQSDSKDQLEHEAIEQTEDDKEKLIKIKHEDPLPGESFFVNSGKIFHGDGCDYIAPNKSNLNNHMKSNTIEDEDVSAPNALDSQIEGRSRGEDVIYRCDQCDYLSHSDTNLKIHKHSHRIYKFSCDQCDYKGRSIGHVKNHIVLRHHGFPCDECDHIFTSYDNFIVHKATVHRRSNAQCHHPTCNYRDREWRGRINNQKVKSELSENKLQEFTDEKMTKISNDKGDYEHSNVVDGCTSTIETEETFPLGESPDQNEDHLNRNKRKESFSHKDATPKKPKEAATRSTCVYNSVPDNFFSARDRTRAILLILFKMRGNIDSEAVADLTGTSAATVANLRHCVETGADIKDFSVIMKRNQR